MKLTKKAVDAIAPDPKGRRYDWDSTLVGFGLVTQSTGAKSFVFQYRDSYAKTRRIVIGRYGDWTPDEARRKAEKLREAVKAGHDPLGEKQARRDALTVAAVLDQYLESEP